MRRALEYTPMFFRAAKRWMKKGPQAEAVLHETLSLLEADAFDARLKTHKLKGNRAGYWACSGGYDFRIIFEFVRQGEEEVISLLLVGTHDEVY